MHNGLIERRTFLQTGVACLLERALSPSALALPMPGLAITSQVLPLNTHWRWSRMPSSGDGHSPELDDSSFESVTLPHSNVFVPWHNIDQKSYQFVSLYRRRFTLTPGEHGRRVFVDFGGAMTASKVFLNGMLLGEYVGGFTPFSFELTQLLHPGSNLLSVELDSREIPEVPPFGYEIDYLTYGGIYREVQLRCSGPVAIDSVRAICHDPLSLSPKVEASLWFDAAGQQRLSLLAEILDGEHALTTISRELTPTEIAQGQASAVLDQLRLELWELDRPKLYTLRATLSTANEREECSTRFGVREARFTPEGFILNGKVVKLRGLNRHQSFPFTGFAMPARVQRRDAVILKQLHCNIVRCSHYPPSTHFLDACDELGLLVIDETPGWQHVGEGAAWRARFLDNNRRMIRRDWNHPSIVLWSIRINESRDFHDLYLEANQAAHALDSTRQTTGVRYFQESELLEDVFSMNDFGFPLKTPNHPLYLNTEVVGAEYPVRPWDNNTQHREHILRYANILNQINSNAAYAGVVGWCAFDYQTHSDFGSGDHICYHGVLDTFRVPKPAAGFFRSQCSVAEEPVLEPGFHFAMNDEPGGFKDAVICSNCDEIHCLLGSGDSWREVITLTPARNRFPHLAHPPFFLTLPNGNDDWADLRLDGYVAGRPVISRRLSSLGIDQRFDIMADDQELIADGSDATRVVLRVTDQYGEPRPLCFDPVRVTLAGPATLLGTPELSLAGGHSAIWIRAATEPGTVVFTAIHPTFGEARLQIRVIPRPLPSWESPG